MICGIHHAGLTVLELDNAIGFYSRAAGLIEVGRIECVNDQQFSAVTGIQDHAVVIVLLRGPNAFLALLKFDSPLAQSRASKRVCDAGITHICSQFPDMSVLERGFRSAGADFHTPPFEVAGGSSLAYIRDPEQNTIELQNADVTGGIGLPWLNHIGYSTHDIERLPDFYAGLLECEIASSAEYGGSPELSKVIGLSDAHLKVAWIERYNQTLEIMQYVNPPTVEQSSPRQLSDAGWAYSCFEVVDIQREYERISALGATFVSEPQALHGAQMCMGTDPDGNWFALLEPGSGKARVSLRDLEHADIMQRTRISKSSSQESHP